MTLNPIDSHCHLFSAKYAVEEAAAMGWAYVRGNYPHAESMKLAAERGSIFSWNRLTDKVKWFFDLGAALSGYEDNRAHLIQAAREGLGLDAGTAMPCVPLMMDIFYMFGPPASELPVPAVAKVSKRAEKPLPAEDLEASEAALLRFEEKVSALAAAAAEKLKGRRKGLIAARGAEPSMLSPDAIAAIFQEAKGQGAARGVLRGLATSRELSLGFVHEIEDLIALQAKHPKEVFPLFAVDPRRRGVIDMAIRGIPELNGGKPLVSAHGPFFGIKLYTRLGYLPGDVPDELYRFCADLGLPIVVHTSTGGFPPGSKWKYAALPEPRLWEPVLTRHPDLRLDLAHFGNGNAAWVTQILGLMERFANVYADLSCYTGKKERDQAYRLWCDNSILKKRLIFGTDFVISSLTKVLSLKGYFKAFYDLYGADDLKMLMDENPRTFLSPILSPKGRLTVIEERPLPVGPAAEEKLRRKLGWLPDLPDYRDHTPDTDDVPRHVMRMNRQQTVKSMLAKTETPIGRRAAAGAAQSLPACADLRPWCSPIEDQGSLGSCTAHAAAALIEYYERRAFGSYIDISRLFLYKATRNLLKWTGDTGAYLRTTMEAMVLFGVPPEEYFPYDPANVDAEPSAFCYSFAQNYQTLDYFRLDAAKIARSELLERIRRKLASGIPAMFGFTVFSSIANASATGRIPFPAKNDRREGGHAVAAMGYDDGIAIRHPYTGDETRGAILIRNSWGREWGEQGYGWLPYAYVREHLAIDWWTVLKQEYVDTMQFQEPS